jgi:cell division protein FtsQ
MPWAARWPGRGPGAGVESICMKLPPRSGRIPRPAGRVLRPSGRFPRLRPRVVAAVVVAAAVLVGGWLWFRDSSFVAVKHVTVVGASGSEASRIRSALTAAARGSTTLDVQTSKLHRAVSPYPVVKDLDVSTQFPHGLRIKVIEQIPVAVLTAGSRRMVVAGDGTLLRDVRPSPSLPEVSVRALPHGPRLTDRTAMAAVSVLGAAPYQLLSHVGSVTENPTHGIVVELRHGPNLYFGGPTLLNLKWTAAAGVLADSGSAGASYIDVVDPERPAAGTPGAGASSGSAAATTGSGTAASSGSTVAASPTSAAATSQTSAAATSPTSGPSTPGISSQTGG